MKKYFTLAILPLLITSLLTLTGCAALHTESVTAPKVELIAGQWLTLPSPAQLALNVNATQILTAQYTLKNKPQTYTSQLQIEASEQRLVMLAMAGWGGELFSIDYDGINIKTSSLPMPNSAIGIQHTLTDFILTYADAELLRDMLQTTNIKLINKPRQRIFTLHRQPIIKIDYQNLDPWQGNITLRNLKYRYLIKIMTISH
jgi:hypothetical protein